MKKILSQLHAYFTHKRSLSIGMVFWSMGFLFGTWATLIPYVKDKFGLNDAQLGLLLLSMPLGSTVMNPFSTIIIKKLGANLTTSIFMVVMAVFYSSPIVSPVLWGVSIGLIVTGLALSTTNVAMNTAVTMIEIHEKRHIMSSCHGMFSLGGMLGSAAASVALGMGVQPPMYMMATSATVVLVGVLIWQNIQGIHQEAPTDQPKFALPNKILLGMIAISLCTNITEGTMADWAAVYMQEIVHAPVGMIGWGFAAYAMFMASGRFMGDVVIPVFGMRKVLVVGGVLSAIGFLLAVVWPHTWVALVGFSLVGAGVSFGAPILYGSAARMPNMAQGAGLATMNTFSIGGFLAGPAIIGFISKASSLPTAFIFVAVLGVLWSIMSSRNRFY